MNARSPYNEVPLNRWPRLYAACQALDKWMADRKLTRDEERAARRERRMQAWEDFGCDPWDYE